MPSLGGIRRNIPRFFVVMVILCAGITLASAETRLDFGIVKSGSISVIGEVDMFSFPAATGDTIFIKVSKTNGDLWPRIDLWGTDGKSIKKAYDPAAAEITQTLTSGGTYTILVDDGTSWENTGDYNIIIQRLNDPGNGRALQSGASISGSIGVIGKVDTYTFTARSGDTAILKAAKTSGDLWPRIRLHSPNGTLIKSAYGSADAQISQLLTSGGLHVILVDDGTSWLSTGNYNIILQTISPGGAMTEEPTTIAVTTLSYDGGSVPTTATGAPPASDTGFPGIYFILAIAGMILIGGTAVAFRHKKTGTTSSRTSIGEGKEGAVTRRVVGTEIFISYSTEDKPVADAVCNNLESQGIRCWIAPRDILPGTNYQEAIIDAIDSSRIMVLIFSSHSNNSPHVIRELTRAVSKGVVVIPFRIEEVSPSKSMEYLISVPHWLDAMKPPLEQHLEKLGKTVNVLLEQWKEKKDSDKRD
jgi:hypothetical protein